MSRRKGWDTLSSPVRRRYERAGITRAQYQSGASLSTARGHGRTPERPERAERAPDKYRDYLRNKRPGMHVTTTEGVVIVYGMGSGERSLVGKHNNSVRDFLNGRPQGANVVPLTGPRKLPDFRGMTVQGYRDTGSPLETFTLGTDPTVLSRYAQQGQLDFVSIYATTGTQGRAA